MRHVSFAARVECCTIYAAQTIHSLGSIAYRCVSCVYWLFTQTGRETEREERYRRLEELEYEKAQAEAMQVDSEEGEAKKEEKEKETKDGKDEKTENKETKDVEMKDAKASDTDTKAAEAKASKRKSDHETNLFAVIRPGILF